ncbi:DUF2505 domain-containing protein [Mycobacterium xenopi]|uniref:DUF2505 domain-containing protein n=1 Tax=Mycobacterium xenopi TaxID=1789 RepID=A0AAD1M2R4_MYCXE|nr:DUF2505 domain-containing protein [Mycobacterium xenopi]MDA3640043.1 DUF2505 domain-containing protein [Mycobacterium xenopi]MDA3658728.1 DUF2505 domain-containing protein [Mycobacterium xenopi]MDA3660790.1 DUF2505 domain-containing protein [Mycobacterium xenopi]ORX16154.1 hypothetical protein AWC32_13060 [Mycobacterium xenopi]SPX90203.1 Protein of uncharacterised function (DUF2505) [Mycobacterium xenopi]
MPRSFDMSTDYGATVEEVHRAFSEESYWLARLADSGADDATLESMSVGDDGSIDVVTTQVLRSDRLPGLVTQFHRGDLCIRREETWGPVTGGTAQATVTGSILDAPVGLTGTAVLAPLPESGGARLTFRATVEVRIPLVGGKIENFIGSQLVELLIAEQRFTTIWISQNA